MNISHIDAVGYTEDQLKKVFNYSKSLSIDIMVNSEKSHIDYDKQTIFNDVNWKGFFPVAHVLNFFSSNFHSGFKKRFFRKDNIYAGVTSDSDGLINAENILEEKENSQFGKHILLKYTEIPWRGFYDVFKVVSDKLLVGKAFMGKYPNGVEIFTFPMVREYDFDNMTVEDHLKIFKNGERPILKELEGVWDMAAVSNSNHRVGAAKLAFDLKPDNRLEGRYLFMNIVQGHTRTELTEDELRMHDFTPFHDSIRSINKDYMVGKWCAAKKELFGPMSAGLLQFEPTADGQTRFCFYYTLKRSSMEKLPPIGAFDRLLKLKLGTGITFEEEMVGSYCPGELKEPKTLESGEGVHCQFNVKIDIADLDEFVASSEHRATLTGKIYFAEFNGEQDVTGKLEEGSTFNYLQINPETDEREMKYHIRFKHKSKMFVFDGVKFMQKDQQGGIKANISEILEDYTTLYCHVSQEDGNKQEGVAKLKFRTFEDIQSIKGLLEFGGSFRVTGTTNLWKKIASRNKFNAFTMQFIFAEYNPFGL